MIERSILADSDLKVARAKHHIDDFTARAAQFLAQRPFKMVIGPGQKAGQRSIYIKETKSIPKDFSLIIGDAVHNLRSALDILIFGLIGSKATRPEAVQFPFAKSGGQAFETTLRNRQIILAGKSVQTAIANLRPYSNGNRVLYGLHELDIADKHKLILTAATATDITADDLAKVDPMLSRVRGSGVIRFGGFQNEKPLFLLRAYGRNRHERRAQRVGEQVTRFQPKFSICFGKNLPFEGQLVIEVLGNLMTETERTIESVAQAA